MVTFCWWPSQQNLKKWLTLIWDMCLWTRVCWFLGNVGFWLLEFFFLQIYDFKLYFQILIVDFCFLSRFSNFLLASAAFFYRLNLFERHTCSHYNLNPLKRLLPKLNSNSITLEIHFRLLKRSGRKTEHRVNEKRILSEIFAQALLTILNRNHGCMENGKLIFLFHALLLGLF